MSIEFSFNDEKTWNLFAEGRTKGIFQLESNLGKTWSKKSAPRNIEELAALISIIRPGSLNAKINGKQVTQIYVDRKHGRDPVTYLHESLEDILSSTYGVIVYQEQAMLIAQKLAGFDLKEADVLRKAIGKKKADLMAETKKKFMEGCKKTNVVDQDIASEIFSWIEKSARYLFNKSHGVAYAYNSYMSAWYKANYTYDFFLTYLEYSAFKPDPQQEIYDLVSESKLFDIEYKMPNIKHYTNHFSRDNNVIYFGVQDIKNLKGVNGKNALDIITQIGKDRPLAELSWLDILLYISTKIDATSFKTLCSIGFFSTVNTGISRNRALYEYEIFKPLTDKEKEWITEHYKDKQWMSLIECLKDLAPTKKNGGGTHNINRSKRIESEIYMLENPPFSLEDDPAWIVDQETELIGCPISLARIDSVDTAGGNTSCKDIVNGKTGKNICLAASIVRINQHKVKRGKTKGQLMAFLSIEDDTCVLDSVILFPETRAKYEYILYEGNTLMFCGDVGEDNSFIIQKIYEI